MAGSGNDMPGSIAAVHRDHRYAVGSVVAERSPMSLTPLLVVLFGVAVVCLLFATGHGVGAHRRWRERRRVAATLRVLWCLVFLGFALLGGLAGIVLLGYRRLAAEAEVARIEAHALSAQRYAVDILTPDGERQHVELAGDDWQLDARVIKWTSRAVILGAPPLYRLERIGGRYRDIAQERTAMKSVAALDDSVLPDLWTLKRRFPQWLPWIDADYGSAAYLPLVDDGRYVVTLAAAGGLVARPADEETARRIAAAPAP